VGILWGLSAEGRFPSGQDLEGDGEGEGTGAWHCTIEEALTAGVFYSCKYFFETMVILFLEILHYSIKYYFPEY
jgi:hypothetical protein